MSVNRRNACRSAVIRITGVTLLALLASGLGACGDPKSRPVPIVVTFNSANPPPASLETGAFAAIAADVANDSQNAGVTFSCTPLGACGSFTPPSAGTTDPVCYLAPDAIPSGDTVTVTATSVTDTTKSVSATITIVSGAPNPCP